MTVKNAGFNSLSNNRKQTLIYELLTQVLGHIGIVEAKLTDLEAKYEGIKEQLDILANSDFLQQTIKEKQKE